MLLHHECLNSDFAHSRARISRQILHGSREAFFFQIFTNFGTLVYYHTKNTISTSKIRRGARSARANSVKHLNSSKEAIFGGFLLDLVHRCIITRKSE